MKINEVEALVGITRKNIRFYEAEGSLFQLGFLQQVGNQLVYQQDDDDAIDDGFGDLFRDDK